MALLSLISLPAPVPQLGLRLVQVPLGDLPEGLDLVSLQLEVALLLLLAVQLLPEVDDVVLQLEVRHAQVTETYCLKLQFAGNTQSLKLHLIVVFQVKVFSQAEVTGVPNEVDSVLVILRS